MRRADRRPSIVESPWQPVEVVVGLGLLTVAIARFMLGTNVAPVSWVLFATAALSGFAIAIRQRWPFSALVVAISSGLLAMSIDLRNSAIDLLLGLGLIAFALGRCLCAEECRHGRAQLLRRRAASDARTRWSMVALVAAAFVGVAVIPVDLKEAAAIALLLAARAVGRTTDRISTVIAAAAAAVALAVGGWLIAADAWTGPDTPVPLIAAALVGAAAGDASRSRRELQAAAEEHAWRVEQAHAEESRRRVVEERLHIARDVHDLVAHHLAVVNVHAGVAHHMMRDQPDAAKGALSHVRSASSTALDELGTLMSVLRDPSDATTLTAPAPSLADLGSLLNTLRAAGLPVDFTIVGSSRPLPQSVDLSAYRIVQESLTNAHKHGRGQTRLTVTYRADRLEIDVHNALKAPANSSGEVAGSGHGLTGMRERATTVGGTIEAGPAPDGEFVVKVSLPAPLVETKGIA
jgi:signal transduction histidine kinase